MVAFTELSVMSATPRLSTAIAAAVGIMTLNIARNRKSAILVATRCRGHRGADFLWACGDIENIAI